MGRVGVALLCILAFCSASSDGDAPSEQGVKHYNTLGRTGLKVSDIGFGAGGTTDPAVIQYALDMGINYFDTAEQYAGGRSESAIGEVAAEHRDKMVICTKLEMNGNTTAEEVFTRFDACLERLQTDYVDILMIHGGNRDALDNPAIYAAFDSLKARGKIGWTGVSHHGPDIASELRTVIAEDKLDVILCSFDPVGDPDIPAMLEEARAKGIGLVAMKVLPSAREADLEEFESEEHPFHIAALRWALKESGMHSVLVSITMMDEIDEYVEASGAGSET
jgi:aryl-alcohol dehydrogenase-like predicted oxidoreductase